jgi:hypothetical protein
MVTHVRELPYFFAARTSLKSKPSKKNIRSSASARLEETRVLQATGSFPIGAGPETKG